MLQYKLLVFGALFNVVSCCESQKIIDIAWELMGEWSFLRQRAPKEWLLAT